MYEYVLADDTPLETDHLALDVTFGANDLLQRLKFSTTAHPFHTATCKNVPFEWSDE